MTWRTARDRTRGPASRLAEGASSVLDLGCGTGTARRRALGRSQGGRRRSGPCHARHREGASRWRAMPVRRGGCPIRSAGRDIRPHRHDRARFPGFSHGNGQGSGAGDRRSPPRAAGPLRLRQPESSREEWREWTADQSDRVFDHPVHGSVRAWNDVEHDAGTGLVTYGTYYALSDGRTLSARSTIAFPDHGEILSLCTEAGLPVDPRLGDWDGREFEQDSPEIIPSADSDPDRGVGGVRGCHDGHFRLSAVPFHTRTSVSAREKSGGDPRWRRSERYA